MKPKPYYRAQELGDVAHRPLPALLQLLPTLRLLPLVLLPHRAIWLLPTDLLPLLVDHLLCMAACAQTLYGLCSGNSSNFHVDRSLRLREERPEEDKGG